MYSTVNKDNRHDIKPLSNTCSRVRALSYLGSSEKTISNAMTQIKKLQADADNAKQNFERAKEEANAKIEDANKRIQKANDDLKKNMESVAKSAQ